MTLPKLRPTFTFDQERLMAFEKIIQHRHV